MHVDLLTVLAYNHLKQAGTSLSVGPTHNKHPLTVQIYCSGRTKSVKGNATGKKNYDFSRL